MQGSIYPGAAFGLRIHLFLVEAITSGSTNRCFMVSFRTVNSSKAGRSQTTIWNFDKPKKNKNHPTSKPLDLLAYPIGNSSQENAIVIDTFGGSGSTLMTCEQTNRICHTMELDEKYASVILRRYVEDTGDTENVYVIRNGEKLMYSDLVKELEV